MSLLKKIKLSHDWRAHPWILSRWWPEQFPESRILQPHGRPGQATFSRNKKKLVTNDTKNLLERSAQPVCHTIVTWQLSRFSL